jgi:hypothetical protein
LIIWIATLPEIRFENLNGFSGVTDQFFLIKVLRDLSFSDVGGIDD